MGQIAAVIFDLDDTLYSERAFAFSGFDAVARAFADRLGDSNTASARMRELFDTPQRPRVFNAILQERGQTDDAETIRCMIDTYRTHTPRIAPYPDVPDTLTSLRENFKLGLISDGPAIMQRAKLSALGLEDRFDAIVLTDELGKGFGKPHPLAFERIAKQLQIEHARCAYIADNATKDFVAPNVLGWRTVQVCRSDGIYFGLRPPVGGEPARSISLLSEIKSAIS